jgi:hypothetical protein
VVSPKGERQTVRLDQTGPGHYEARFPTKEVGSYLLNLLDVKDGKIRGSQVVGASINYSPEFSSPEPNFNLLKKLSELGRGRILDPTNPADNPFLHDRTKTYQPKDLWEWLLRFAIVMFTVDVGVRRIQLDRQEILKAWAFIRRKLLFWEGKPRPVEADESLAALLHRRDQVRSQTQPVVQASEELFRPKATVTLPQAEAFSTQPQPLSATPAAEEESQPPADKPTTTTSRLLEAKRRAQRKKDE